jgi:hypothetical protein
MDIFFSNPKVKKSLSQTVEPPVHKSVKNIHHLLKGK